MNRIMALLMGMLLAGCGTAPTSILGSSVTNIKSGNYSGAITCAGAITDENGTARFEGELSIERTIGASGLPVENGIEAVEGQALQREIGGYAATISVNSVIVDANEVAVNASGYTESEECVDAECTETEFHSIEIIVSEHYTPAEENGVNLDSLYSIFIWHNGETIGTGSFACTGVLSE